MMIGRKYLGDKSFEDLDRIIIEILHNDNLSNYEKILHIESEVVIPLLDEIDNLNDKQ